MREVAVARIVRPGREDGRERRGTRERGIGERKGVRGGEGGEGDRPVRAAAGKERARVGRGRIGARKVGHGKVRASEERADGAVGLGIDGIRLGALAKGEKAVRGLVAENLRLARREDEGDRCAGTDGIERAA